LIWFVSVKEQELDVLLRESMRAQIRLSFPNRRNPNLVVMVSFTKLVVSGGGQRQPSTINGARWWSMEKGGNNEGCSKKKVVAMKTARKKRLQQ